MYFVQCDYMCCFVSLHSVSLKPLFFFYRVHEILNWTNHVDIFQRHHVDIF